MSEVVIRIILETKKHIRDIIRIIRPGLSWASWGILGMFACSWTSRGSCSILAKSILC